jgi:hypothetical protein
MRNHRGVLLPFSPSTIRSTFRPIHFTLCSTRSRMPSSLSDSFRGVVLKGERKSELQGLRLMEKAKGSEERHSASLISSRSLDTHQGKWLDTRLCGRPVVRGAARRNLCGGLWATGVPTPSGLYGKWSRERRCSRRDLQSGGVIRSRPPCKRVSWYQRCLRWSRWSR